MSEIKQLPFAPSMKDVNKLHSLASGVFLGAASSAASWLLHGNQVGIEVGIAIGGATTGALWSHQSYQEGLDYAATGNKTRAYIKALESITEAALGGAALLAPLGYHLGSAEGAVFAGIGGGLITGVGSARIVIRDISKRLQEDIKSNVIKFQPRKTVG